MNVSNILTELRRLLTLGRMRGEIAYDRAKYLLEDTLRSPEPGVTSGRSCDGHELIASLTTYGTRLHTVYLPIASLMRQSLRPDRIILWLEEGLRDSPLPASLELLKRRGLEVEYCPDLKSYKKLIPAMRAHPDAVIVTFDDDMIYDFGLIDRLVSSYRSRPDCVHTARMRRIVMTPDGKIAPYTRWPLVDDDTISPLNLATGGAGTLYPPHLFGPEMCDESLFLSLAPTADDLWFKAMELHSGIDVVKAPTLSTTGDDYIPVLPIDWRRGLVKTNITGGGNDATVRALHRYFSLLNG